MIKRFIFIYTRLARNWYRARRDKARNLEALTDHGLLDRIE